MRQLIFVNRIMKVQLIDWIHEAADTGIDGIVFNPGALYPYKYCLT